jgi:hypothetical protein
MRLVLDHGSIRATDALVEERARAQYDTIARCSRMNRGSAIGGFD